MSLVHRPCDGAGNRPPPTWPWTSDRRSDEKVQRCKRRTGLTAVVVAKATPILGTEVHHHRRLTILPCLALPCLAYPSPSARRRVQVIYLPHRASFSAGARATVTESARDDKYPALGVQSDRKEARDQAMAAGQSVRCRSHGSSGAHHPSVTPYQCTSNWTHGHQHISTPALGVGT